MSWEIELPADAEGPITATVARRVKPGHEAAFEEFLTGIGGAAKAFPGYLGSVVFRPAGGQSGTYRIVYRFDSPAHLRGWLDSDEHAAWMERAAPHVAGPMRTGTEFLTGLESWFTLPMQPGTPPPPPYKMAVLTWVTIFPLITLVIVVSAPLIRSLPLIPKLAVTTLVTVALMTWVVMPRVTRLLRGWLYPGRRR
jgi:antibiotic biosynthesis monooxygenase (ABM) superfamily enzyme